MDYAQTMYKQKVIVFAALISVLVILTSVLVVATTQITRTNLTQNNIAQALLNEHIVVSGTSYRLFKQLTDELIFGKDANQAEVRNKSALIEQSIAKIIQLEEQQRQALGEEATQGSVEDTAALAELLDEIIVEFRAVIAQQNRTQIEQRERMQRLLEVTIDNRFREAINAAVTRQSKVVASLNARIETLSQSILWYAILLAVFTVPMVFVGFHWLLSVLYQPLNSIREGAEAIAQGNLNHRISRGFDAEFDSIAAAFNSMAEELSEQREKAQHSTRELEYQVSQRTAELTHANQLLQNNDKARREFLADISHELRTPLSIIRGEAQVTLRQKRVSEEDYQSTLEAVLEQVLNLTRLVDDLLMIARAESGALRIVPQTVNIDDLIHSTVERVQSVSHAEQLELVTDIADDLPLVSCDPDRIAQVVMILLDNAINYAGDRIRVLIRCQMHERTLTISVEDNGRGIDADVLPFVFDRYFRAADARTGQGSGLGLAIAKAIIDAHKGEISASSIVGQGTRFVIELPTHGEPRGHYTSG